MRIESQTEYETFKSAVITLPGETQLFKTHNYA